MRLWFCCMDVPTHPMPFSVRPGYGWYVSYGTTLRWLVASTPPFMGFQDPTTRHCRMLLGALRNPECDQLTPWPNLSESHAHGSGESCFSLSQVSLALVLRSLGLSQGSGETIGVSQARAILGADRVARVLIASRKDVGFPDSYLDVLENLPLAQLSSSLYLFNYNKEQESLNQTVIAHPEQPRAAWHSKQASFYNPNHHLTSTASTGNGQHKSNTTPTNEQGQRLEKGQIRPGRLPIHRNALYRHYFHHLYKPDLLPSPYSGFRSTQWREKLFWLNLKQWRCDFISLFDHKRLWSLTSPVLDITVGATPKQ